MYYQIATILLILGLLRIFIIEFYKNERFKNFKKFYPDEPFEKLSEYEEKSKIKVSLLERKKINDS